jgi:hypothetical protein
MFCLATKILTYLPFFYLIIFMTSNCQDALGQQATGLHSVAYRYQSLLIKSMFQNRILL